MNKKDEIHSKLRELRRARGITVEELADEINENSQKVGRIERGKRSLTVDYLLKVSKALAAPIETLFGGSVEENFEANPNVLNDVVVLVEDLCTNQYSSQQKAKIISKIYEIILKIPAEFQPIFIQSLNESIKLFLCK